jgi:hypothetical protein
VEENVIDPNIQASIDEQRNITRVLTPKFPGRVVSVADTELELELAQLVYGHPEAEYAENPLRHNTIRSTEV